MNLSLNYWLKQSVSGLGLTKKPSGLFNLDHCLSMSTSFKHTPVVLSTNGMRPGTSLQTREILVNAKTSFMRVKVPCLHWFEEDM